MEVSEGGNSHKKPILTILSVISDLLSQFSHIREPTNIWLRTGLKNIRFPIN
jgi:hypothetical protein